MDSFYLSSIELDTFTGAAVSYSIPGENGMVEFKAKKFDPVHPDLSDILLVGLKCRVAWLLGFDISAQELPVSPCGAIYPKDGEVIYIARVKGPEGAYKVKTPKIKCTEEDDSIRVLLEAEAREYILFGKSAQLSIFGE